MNNFKSNLCNAQKIKALVASEAMQNSTLIYFDFMLLLQETII